MEISNECTGQDLLTKLNVKINIKIQGKRFIHSNHYSEGETFTVTFPSLYIPIHGLVHMQDHVILGLMKYSYEVIAA